MSNINLTNLTESTTVTEQEAADVKGGPAFMKLGDIKGEASYLQYELKDVLITSYQL